jgi:hypothetical protein
LKFTTQQLLDHPKFAQLTGTAAKAFKPQTANAAPGVRIRQDSKPLMNELEQEWFNLLKTDNTILHLRAQVLKFLIGNNAFYRPDMTAMVGAVLHAWECKGPRGMKNQDRGYLALKSAAAQWPEVRFILVFKDGGAWKSQEVLA